MLFHNIVHVLEQNYYLARERKGRRREEKGERKSEGDG